MTMRTLYVSFFTVTFRHQTHLGTSYILSTAFIQEHIYKTEFNLRSDGCFDYISSVKFGSGGIKICYLIYTLLKIIGIMTDFAIDFFSVKKNKFPTNSNNMGPIFRKINRSQIQMATLIT